MSHTPGPWKVKSTTFMNRPKITVGPVNDESHICSIIITYKNTDEIAHNTLLIAAAPDMLAALEVADACLENFDVVDTGQGGSAVAYYFEQSDIDQIKAAIKKARGL